MLPKTGTQLMKLGGPSMTEIHTEIVQIPLLQIKSDGSECSICLDVIDGDNKYVSRCHHVFHTECIYRYAKANDCVKLADRCQIICSGHGEKIMKFNCPICRTILEKN